MQQTERKPLFDLGQLVATPGALMALEKSGQSPMDFLSRHVTGDWGELTEGDRKENQLSVEKGFRILSSYRTNAGETSLLNVLGKFIPSDERILLIEDTSEIHMCQDNLVRFEARQPQCGLPPVSIRDLPKASLRHRPDRLILGEIRGSEAFDLLQLLPGASARFMPLRRSRPWPGSQVVCCRAAWIYLSARLKRMSVIP
jgi:pilus assembly protein CpaF